MFQPLVSADSPIADIGAAADLAAQVTLGLFAQNVDGIESGPLSYLVSYDAADAARELLELEFNIILTLVGLHIAAIAYYAVGKRDNIVTPMLTGIRRFASEVDQPELLRPGELWFALYYQLGWYTGLL